MGAYIIEGESSVELGKFIYKSVLVKVVEFYGKFLVRLTESGTCANPNHTILLHTTEATEFLDARALCCSYQQQI